MKKSIIALVFVSLLGADGGFIPPPGNVEIYSADQVAVIKILPGIEELSILVKSEWIDQGGGDYGGFAWVIPLPNIPEIGQLDAELFSDLAYLSAPIRPTGGCAGPFTLGDNGGTYGGSIEPGREYYDIISYDTLGFLESVLIQTNTADSLTNWLTNNGYITPADAEEIFADYITRDWYYFFVARVDTTSESDDRNVAVKLTFATDEIVYPMKISSISSSAGNELYLYTIGEHKMFFDGAELEYANLITSEELDAILIDFPALAAYIEQGSYITKLKCYYNTPEDMDEDILLYRSPDDTEYRKLAGGGYYLHAMSNSILLSLILLLVYIGFHSIRKIRSSISPE
ncbi:MAG: DUF2330 domain-containing protein [candidate division WOR-3 bacterium]|jgi:hypothetical protein